MGAAIDAIPTTLEGLVENPIIVPVAIAAAIVTGILFVLMSLIPIIGPMVAAIFVTPLFTGGFLAMVNVGLDGKASVEDFIEGVQENYLSLAGVYAILLAVFLVIGIGFAILLVFVIGFGGAMTSPTGSPGSPSPELLAGAGAVGLLLILVAFLVTFAVTLVLQFLDVSVVIGGESATSAFGRSIDIVKSGPLSAIGYTILRTVLIWLIIGIPTIAVGVVSTAAIGEQGSLITMLVYAIALPIAYIFAYSYHAAYFRERTITA